MCRFCACNLSKSELSKKCAYKKYNQTHEVPWFTDPENIVEFHPSNSLEPKQNNGLPVVIHGGHVQKKEERVFCPMYWTLIPPWHKTDLDNWKASTYNARVENITSGHIYSLALKEDKRCVIVMEGFFEFKNSELSEVYYLESKQKKLLMAAGLFSIIKNNQKKTLYSCSVLTTATRNNAKEVHHRIPLFLNDESDIEAWLDYKNVSHIDALEHIKQSDTKNQQNLNFYRTNKAGSKERKGEMASSSLMKNWLQCGKKSLKRKADEIDEESQNNK